MAQFYNGSERRGFQEHFCGHCLNNRGEGCTINVIYDFFAYDRGKPEKEETRQILDLLIAENRSPNAFNTFSCTMFIKGASEREEETGDSLIANLIERGLTAEFFEGGTLLTGTEAQA